MPSPGLHDILFAWAHLSDLHVGQRNAAGQSLVLDEIARDLGGAAARGCPKLDAILVTGDVAWSGKAGEYDEATTLIARIVEAGGVAEGNVFVVPGNHDIDRSADADRNVKRLLNELRAGGETIDAALADDGDRALLQRRLTPFLAFAAGYAPGCANLFWVHRFASRGLPVRVVGLDTVLASADGKGKLWLGTQQIAAALDGRVEGELIVVLSHHPFRGGWLGDENDADAWVRNHAHLHLFGHVKDAASEAALSGAGGRFVRFAAGAAGAEPGEHGYGIGAIVRKEDGTLAVRAWPRRWSDRNKRFRDDLDGVPEGQRFAEHGLHLRLPLQRSEGPKESGPSAGCGGARRRPRRRRCFRVGCLSRPRFARRDRDPTLNDGHESPQRAILLRTPVRPVDPAVI